MSQNNRYMSVSVTETKADTKKAKSGVQSSYASAVDASVAALNREFGIYKRENEIEMDELRTKIRAAAKSGGGSGEAGKDGVGIEKVEQTVTSTESGGENKVEVTLTDGKKSEFVVRNGENGKKGDKGERGESGVYVGSGDMPSDCNVQIDVDGDVVDLDAIATEALLAHVDLLKGDKGDPGNDGTSVTVSNVSTSSADGGSNVITFSDGKTITIKNGSKGNDGYTPNRGTDYWTSEDKEQMVNDVLAALPVYEGEVEDV